MANTLKTLVIALIALVVGFGAGYFIPPRAATSGQSFGAATSGSSQPSGHYETVSWNFLRGISTGNTNQFSVSGSTGNVTTQGTINSADITAVNGANTTTIASGSSASGVNPGKLCLWNGANYSIVSFTSGSTSVAVATSTACQ